MSRIGIDISEHNGTIDFSKLKEQGIEFVIIRIGWIGNYDNHTLDSRFYEYLQGCTDYQIPVGLYVYNYCKSPNKVLAGCEWIYNKIKGMNFPYPVFIDMEDSTIIECGIDNLTEQCINFCKFFEEKGYRAGIYANKNWFTNYLKINDLLNYKIWIAEWNNRDNHTFNYKVDLWQYTSNGLLSGSKSRFDMNKCLCDCNNTNNVKNEEKNTIIEKEDELEVKIYQNGSTTENVYSDTALTTKIGSLNKYEKCECLGTFYGRAMVRYQVDKKDNYKIGFVKWLGGIK